MRQLRRPAPPTGWRRTLARLPVLLYRLRLGWLLGSRFLLIHHVGRTTGLPRTVVVEVVDHDPAAGTWTVASGFGPQAQWYRNLLATPQVRIEVGRRRLAVTAQPLDAEAGAAAMVRYAAAHPRTAQRLATFMGFDVDGSTAGYRAVGRAIPFVRFVPRPG
jgi:deazaflavin-dependent oxidoreductase (nitroreductase family)